MLSYLFETRPPGSLSYELLVVCTVSMWVSLAGSGFCCSEFFELHALSGLHDSIGSEFVLGVFRSSVELSKT